METSLFFRIPNLLLFFSMFFVIYFFAYFIVFRSWSPKIRPEASSCLISLFHGTPAVFLSTFAIFSDQNRGFSSSNTKTQNLVLDYSIAYFLTDLLHYIIFLPSDILFIGHHLATLFVFITCRHLVVHGAYAILFLLILAEVTSFCQNVWTLATARRYDDELAAKWILDESKLVCGWIQRWFSQNSQKIMRMTIQQLSEKMFSRSKSPGQVYTGKIVLKK
ncbi:hypothetical protein CRYUN_Cryun22dG0009800 [Craigia yunnanensis]